MCVVKAFIKIIGLNSCLNGTYGTVRYGTVRIRGVFTVCKYHFVHIPHVQKMQKGKRQRKALYYYYFHFFCLSCFRSTLSGKFQAKQEMGQKKQKKRGGGLFCFDPGRVRLRLRYSTSTVE